MLPVTLVGAPDDPGQLNRVGLVAHGGALAGVPDNEKGRRVRPDLNRYSKFNVA